MKRISLFTLLACAIAWVPCIWLMIDSAALLLYSTVTFAFCMFAPSIAMVLTRLLTKEGFADMKLRLHFKGNLKWYLAAWFGPNLLILAGGVVWFLLNPGTFDPSCSYFAGLMGMDAKSFQSLIFAQMAFGILAGPAINFIPALGEEAGWRGYLLPHLLKRMGVRKAMLVSGIIWGLWHAPMIALGHNYGVGYAGYPWLGIGAMTVFCVAVGSFFALLSIKTDSAIPCALAHAGLNAMASICIYFAAGETNPFVGPLPTGIIGGAGFLILAVVLFLSTPRWTNTSHKKDALA